MNARHRKYVTGNHKVDSKEGQRGFLCRNKTGYRCPSLDFTTNQTAEKAAVDYLAQILVRIFLSQHKHAQRRNHVGGKETDSHLLQGLD